MNCPKCKAELPDGARFCHDCGAGIAAVSGESDLDNGKHSLGDMQTFAGDPPGDADSNNKKAPPSLPNGDTPGVASLGDMQTLDEESIPDGADESLGDMQTIVSESGKLRAVGDRFDVIGELGRGGMGAVYKAEDRKLGRTVALKCLHAETAENRKAIERFWREAKVVASLSHFNIVQVFDIIEDGTKLWIVMEYLPGGSLQDALDRDGALDAEQVREIGVQLAGALSAAHEKGIFHRDVKPANILLTATGTPKLGDFGLARENETRAQMTIAGARMGTPYYAAPEQMVSGSNVDARSDIYALGATLYALATGEAPRSIRPERVSDAGLRDVIARCLEERPDRRYPSASALIDALRECADGGETITTSDVGCPSCGRKNPIDVKFCHECGGDLSGLFEKCPKCGHENRKDLKFCGGCGLNLAALQAFRQEFSVNKEQLSTDEAIELLESGLNQFPDDQRLEQEMTRFKGIRDRIESFLSESRRALEERNFSDVLSRFDDGDSCLKKHPGALSVRQKAREIEREHAADWDEFRNADYADPATAVAALEGLSRKYPWDSRIQQRLREENEVQSRVRRRKKFRKNVKLIGVPLLALGALIAVVGLGAVASLRVSPARTRTPDRIPTNPSEGQVITNSIGMELVYIPPGRFMMGSPETESGRFSDEGPRRSVTISRGFWMGRYPVTQAQYLAVTGGNPSRFKGGDRPVESVSWNDAAEFLEKLSEGEERNYRLPTEAEWEYAARAGTTTAYYFGDDAGRLGDYAWHSGSSRTHPVGQKTPNAWGLYDMHGNVCEWCSDWYQDSYRGLPETDPTGPNTGTSRVLRGGSWLNDPGGCRSASRVRGAPGSRLSGGSLGFRLVLDFP